MTLSGSVDYNDTMTASSEELAFLSKVVYEKVRTTTYNKKNTGYEKEKDKYGAKDNKSAAEVALEEWQNEDYVQQNPTLRGNLENWTVLTDIPETKGGLRSSVSGMQAVAYMNNKTGEIVIAYRGTDSGLDFVDSDVPIGLNVTPMQQKAAQKFYEDVHKKYPDAKIIVTGHSLGGALAQGVAYEKDLYATTYNAPGIQKENTLKSDKIVNYVNMNDPIGCYGEHIGETRYYLPDGKYRDGSYSPHSDFYKQDFSKYKPLKNNVKWDHNDAAAIHGYDVRNDNIKMKTLYSGITQVKNLPLALYKLERSGVKTDLNGVSHYKAGGKLYSLEADDGKIVNCSYPKGKDPKEQPAVHKKPKDSPTGGASPVKTEGTKTSGGNKTDEDGHWITTKKGQHVFIEDEEPSTKPRFFIYDLMQLDEDGSFDLLSRPVTYDGLLENARKGDLMKNVDENKYWNYEMNPVTKVGVFDYLGSQLGPEYIPDKVYKVYRSAEEIASPEALRTLRLLPVIDDHQMLGVGAGLMPAEEKGVHGVLGDTANLKDGYLYSDMRIFSEHLKEQISNGKRELSLGYRCEYDNTPGVYNGIPYDMKQVKIRYNHLALVNQGRMGSDVCVMDSKISFDEKGYAAPVEIDYGIPEVFFSNYSPEVLEVRNDPEIIAYLSRKKGD